MKRRETRVMRAVWVALEGEGEEDKGWEGRAEVDGGGGGGGGGGEVESRGCTSGGDGLTEGAMKVEEDFIEGNNREVGDFDICPWVGIMIDVTGGRVL